MTNADTLETRKRVFPCYPGVKVKDTFFHAIYKQENELPNSSVSTLRTAVHFQKFGINITKTGLMV